VSSAVKASRNSNPKLLPVSGNHAIPMPNQIWDSLPETIAIHAVKDNVKESSSSVNPISSCSDRLITTYRGSSSDQFLKDYGDKSDQLRLDHGVNSDPLGLAHIRSSRERSLPVLAHSFPSNLDNSSVHTLDKDKSSSEFPPPLVDNERLSAVTNSYAIQHSYPSCQSSFPVSYQAARGISEKVVPVSGSSCYPPFSGSEAGQLRPPAPVLYSCPPADSWLQDARERGSLPVNDSPPGLTNITGVDRESSCSHSGSPRSRSGSPRFQSSSPHRRRGQSGSPRFQSSSPHSRRGRSGSRRSHSRSPRSRRESARSRRESLRSRRESPRSQSGSPRSHSISPRSRRESPRHRSRSQGPRSRWSRTDSPASSSGGSDGEESDSDYIRYRLRLYYMNLTGLFPFLYVQQ
jgi:hypothetical protein